MILLYLLPYFISLGSVGDALIIPDWGAGLAAVTLLYSFILYLWPPKKSLFAGSFTIYLLLVIMAGALIMNTGSAYSAFISLWILLGVFASVFGLGGIGAVFLFTIGYIAYLFATSDHPPIGQITVLSASTVTSLIAGFIIFHSKSRKNVVEESTYHELASELSQVSNQAEVVIKAIDDGVISIDSKGNIQLINPAAQRILGWGNAEALKLNYASVLKLSDDKNQAVTDATDPIAKVLATNHDEHTKSLYATTGGGKRILLSLVVSPVGQIGEGAIVVFRDITKESAEEREQAEFISTASHEMRTPVASIEGYLGLALNPNTATIDEKARDFITKAHESAQHLGRLFQDLLDVSKADDGRLSNHPKIVDVVEYVGNVVEGLEQRAKEKGLRLFYKPRPDGEQVGDRMMSPVFYANVDNDHLREVVANLVENAIKYTPKGDVIVDVSGDDDHVTISIQDSGIGIAKEDSLHLFQKFYRIDNSATREIGGTGLGLYLCRRLAEVMGGRIWLDSELGKGSTFYLEIPRTDRLEAMRMLEANETEIISEAVTDEVLEDTPIDQITPAAVTTTSSPIPPSSAPALQPQPQQPAPIAVLPPQPPAPSPTPATAPTNTPTFISPGSQPTPTPLSQQPTASPAVPAAPTLATIEQNPSQYTAAARPSNSMQIPVRGPGDMNNPPRS
ncbi:MAG TPA: ATP-binding protein [Candidatus Saccharimonadales bacterium]